MMTSERSCWRRPWAAELDPAMLSLMDAVVRQFEALSHLHTTQSTFDIDTPRAQSY